METKAHHVLIGAFTLLVIAAAFALVLYVSGTGGLGSGAIFDVVFKGSVGGLTNGSLVTFNGLRAGEVMSVDFAANDPSRVVARIKVESGAPVRADTRARLESQGIGGASTIALYGGAADSPALKGENGKPAVLAGEPSQLANLLDNVASISSKAESAIAKADALLSDNSAAVADAVKNLDEFSKALGDSAPEIKDAMAAVGELGKKLGPVADRLDTTVAAIDPDKVKGIIDNTADLTAKLNASAGKIDGVLTSAQNFLGSPDTKGPIQQLGDAAKSIQQLADDLDLRVKELSVGLLRFTNTGLREYEGLATDGRRTLNDFDHLVHTIETNPSKLLFGK